MTTLKTLYDDIRLQLKGADIESPDLEARMILEYRVAKTYSDIIGNPEETIDPSVCGLALKDMQERVEGKPLSRIYGMKEFYGREFYLGEDTLDPRSDSETLIDAALDILQGDGPKTILDLGTGSGCLLLTLLAECPRARGVGIDLAAGAVEVAQKNAKALGLESGSTFLHGNWFDPLSGEESTPESFDLIVSNPPYISNQIIPILSPEVQNFDPNLALDGGEDGLNAYREIFSQIKNFCHHDTKILLEIGFDQKEEVSRLGDESGFFVARAFSDLGGHDRVLCLVEKQ